MTRQCFARTACVALGLVLVSAATGSAQPYYPGSGYPSLGSAPVNYPFFVPANDFGLPPMNYGTLAPLNAGSNYWPSAAAALQPLTSGPTTGPVGANPNIAIFDIKVPTDAQVWFNDTETRQTGTDRLFSSPELPQVKRYAYDVRARWTADGKTVTRTRTVHFWPGQIIIVDFLNPAG